MTRYLLAPLRCLVQVVLSVVGFILALLAVVAATIVIAYPAAAAVNKGLATLGRRLARGWGGVEIVEPVRTPPPAPIRREDGWYVYNNQLFKSPHSVAFMLKLEWLTKDSSLMREWLWLLFTPFVGAVATGVPLLLIGGAVALVVATSMAAAPFAAAALIVLAIAVGPAALRVHALWSRALLQPAGESWWHRSGTAGWIMRTTRAAWAGAGLAGLSLVAFGLGLVTVLAIIVSWGGWLPYVARISRPWLDFYRRKARSWAGAELPDPYLPYPQPSEPDANGMFRAGRSLHASRASAANAQRNNSTLKDPATWRDLLWMLTTPIMFVVSLIPAAVISIAFFGFVWQAVWWAPWAVPVGLSTGTWVTPWYVWYAVAYVWPALGALPGWTSVPLGALVSLMGCVIAPPLLRLRGWSDGLLLAPTRANLLAQRVRRLTETRSDAVDAQAAELRRIERDLHDGAQARLVAVGLGLATVEQLMEQDPVTARALLIQARESSVTALAELRDLVRGVHPPVLAERGLGDAVRAIALESPLPVEVTVAAPARLTAPVESAAYFAICEALANAARHGNASRVDIDIRYADGVLRATVRDDGHGGADPTQGTGLAGVRKRLGTFDGTLAIASPRGGPTILTMEIPCAL